MIDISAHDRARDSLKHIWGINNPTAEDIEFFKENKASLLNQQEYIHSKERLKKAFKYFQASSYKKTL